MQNRIGHAIRLMNLALAFSVFGVGSIVLAFLAFPLIFLTSFSPETRKRRSRKSIQVCFRIFMRVLVLVRSLEVHETGTEQLSKLKGTIVVATHPSLLDIVILISYLPQADCIVKGALLRNLFMGHVVRATYIPNSASPEKLLDYCAQSLDAGNVLVIFPEGTRTVPGKRSKLSRGAANIALRAERDIVPVRIACHPSCLRKNQKWYRASDEKMIYKIDVMDPIDIRVNLADGEEFSHKSRRITEEIERLLIAR